MADAHISNTRANVVDLVFLSIKFKVVDAIVGYQHDVASLLQSGFQEIQIGYLDVDIRQARVGCLVFIGCSSELDPGSIQGHVNHIVLPPERIAPLLGSAPATLALHTPFVLLGLLFRKFLKFTLLFAFVMLEHTNNGKGLAPDLKDFTDGHDFGSFFLRTSKELIAHTCPDHTDAVGKLFVQVAEETTMLDFVEIHFQHRRPDAHDFGGGCGSALAGHARGSPVQTHFG